jgi:hypothetical protein
MIEANMIKQDEWQLKSETLLYSMIPRTIAERLKRGEDPVNTCEVWRPNTLLLKLVTFYLSTLSNYRRYKQKQKVHLYQATSDLSVNFYRYSYLFPFIIPKVIFSCIDY